jgi:hypothetical protein
MLSRLIRLVLAFTGIAPLLVSISYVQAERYHAIQIATVAAFACVLLAAVSIKIIRLAGSRLERLPVKVKKAKSADKEVLGFYVAYALPLLLRDSSLADTGALIIAGALLAFVLWSTRSFQVNPVLGIFGYYFYEAELEDGMTYLLITQRKLNDLKRVTEVAQLSEHGLLDLSLQQGKGP